MSKSSLAGVLGLHSQTAKGTAATSLNYLPALSIGLDTIQNTQAYNPEIAGDFFVRGAYKAGVTAGGNVSLYVRPNGVGNILYGMCGVDTVTPVPGQTGAYSHVLTPFTPSSGLSLPWMTAVKSVGGLYADQYVDMLVGSVSMDLTAKSLATMQASFFGLTPSETTVPTGYTPDSTTAFNTCVATITLTNEANGNPISANSSLAERITLNFQNQLSQDESAIGSYYNVDSTLLQRRADISFDTVIRDPNLVRAVLRNGGTSAWSPTVFRGHLHITLTSTDVIPSTTQNYSLDIDFPGVDFMTMPVPLQGASLIRATLSAQVSLGTNNDRFSMTLVNGVASY